jgi:HTH-type transcriptional regulator/antitoxin HigA
MDTEKIIRLGQELQEMMPFRKGIHTPAQYDDAIVLMDSLVDDAEKNDLFIDYLFPIIERYEATAPEFKEMNDWIEEMDAGQSVLRILIDHHKLSTADFADEIGDKDIVSLIVDGKQPLTVKHIAALSKRFGINPASFFDH